MDGSQDEHSADPDGGALLHSAAQLAPALDGFPVGQLLDVFMSAGQHDRATAHQLIERCLGHWIATLEGDLMAYPEELDDAFMDIQARQRRAFDALSAFQRTLARTEVVPRHRGQPC